MVFFLNRLKYLSWLVLAVGLLCISSGCIRFTGHAGYVTQTDEGRKSKSVGVDTADWTGPAPGSVTV